MAQAVFNRVEKKYMLSKEQYQALRKAIDPYITEDKYSNYSIRNIYFDTRDYELIRTSIEKPEYKEKFRIRCYGQPNEDSNIFLEIKKKYAGVVNKRRIILPLKEVEAFLEKKENENVDLQISAEIAHVLDKYQLEPKLYLAYDRLAYYQTDDPSFRITFDYNIRSRVDNLTLTEDENVNYLMKPGYMLMEVKITNALPLWFVKVLSELQIFNTSFSKYGTIFQQNLMAGIYSDVFEKPTLKAVVRPQIFINKNYQKSLLGNVVLAN